MIRVSALVLLLAVPALAQAPAGPPETRRDNVREVIQTALCELPDLDMGRYHQLPNNNPPAVLEYGDGSDPEQFEFLYPYSPYHRVKAGTKYPAVLLTSGDFDTRVPPLQARKMTALLQSSIAAERPILLLYDTKAGHSGGKPVVEDLSLEVAFLFWQLNMATPEPDPPPETP